ncbi:hypothetical protein [Maribacter sp. HTCC2170]|uniref:hypothetical protein n=1 Tax=Maribacter sp. (strain HTCC2170 / KCCM 42371) TaxID=313603 RepID=UPI00006B2138|nr:hypothetical protein [Maribacter sp. HTCC2170]EAR00200.1 peptidase T [Maribacter sp. HTCC2170]
MKIQLSYILILFLLFLFGNVAAQEDCVLGVGITKDETIVDVFQLNTIQAEQLINFSAELKYRNELLNNQAENILKRHPQSSAAELMVLAEKYNVIRDSMELVQRMIDIKTLKLFNEKQYQRYLELCNEAFRQPFRVVPTSYRDSIPPK